MKKTASAATLSLALSAVSFLGPAEACSVFYEPRPYAEVLEEIRQPDLLNQIRAASAIYVARVHDIQEGSAEGLPASTLYTFSVQRVIKGDNIFSFPYHPTDPDNHLPLPTQDPTGVLKDPDGAARNLHASFRFWVDHELAIGEMTTLGDCRSYVSFDPGIDYLFILDKEGSTMSAERLPSMDDPWLAAVDYAVGNLLANDFGQVTIEEVFSMPIYPFERITVERCGKSPQIRREDLYEGTREAEMPREQFWFKSGDDPYIEYPFNSENCSVGSSFLVLAYWQWFRIDDENMVSFDDLAFEKRVVGNTRFPVEKIISLTEYAWKEY